MKSNSYIAFEGGDGVYKSTLSKNYAKYLNAFWTFEPYSGDDLPKCKKLREECLSAKSNITSEEREEKLIQSREISLSKLVIPKLKEGINIISDRSFLSGMIYASKSCEKYHDFSQWYKDFFHRIPILPDVIIYCYNNEVNIEMKSDRLDDIYDNASLDFHQDIKLRFEKAIEWLKSLNLGIQFLEFYTDPKLNELKNFVNFVNFMEKEYV